MAAADGARRVRRRLCHVDKARAFAQGAHRRQRRRSRRLRAHAAAEFQILREAQTMLERMAHRGACACDNDSGDGAGVLSAIPDQLYRNELKK